MLDMFYRLEREKKGDGGRLGKLDVDDHPLCMSKKVISIHYMPPMPNDYTTIYHLLIILIIFRLNSCMWTPHNNGYVQVSECNSKQFIDVMVGEIIQTSPFPNFYMALCTT